MKPSSLVFLVASCCAIILTVSAETALSDDYQYSQSLSAHGLNLFAGDGTAITADGKLWRNGKFIPLRDLCPKAGELLDAGWQLRLPRR